MISRHFDPGFTPPIAALQLRWPAEVAAIEQPWRLPKGEALPARPPERFGVRVLRQAEDAYVVWLASKASEDYAIYRAAQDREDAAQDALSVSSV